MTVPVPSAPLPAEAIRKRLNERQISEIVIIDDAFDRPTRDSLGTRALEEFWTAVGTTASALGQLTDLIGAVPNGSALTDIQLDALFARFESLPALKVPCEALFEDTLSKRREIERFAKPLREVLQQTIITLGKADSFDHATVKLIFLDYYLGTTDTEEAVSAAVSRAKQIYQKYPAGGQKPIIVLMSSKPEVDTEKATFRTRSGLLGGMFDFVPKQDLANPEKLYLLLGAWATGLPQAYKIQHFVDALEESVKAASVQFLEGVKSLTIEDYGYIQRLSLQEDGHPLGDYMLWIFGAYFGDLLFHKQPATKAHQKELDSLWIESCPPCQHPPSVMLAEMHKSALFDSSVDNLGPHPLNIGIDPDKQYEAPPALRLGDLFIRDASNQVLLVISPECDLMFSPRGKRSFDPAQSVLLLPGRLQLLTESIPPNENLRTELFEFEGKAYRILWNKKQVRSEKFGRIARCLSIFKYERRARLRLPYALQIQQAFASDLTRVGVPVAPPIFRPVRMRAYYEGEDGKYALLHEPREDAAFEVLGRTGTHLVLTVKYILWLKAQLEGVALNSDKRKDAIDKAKAVEISRYAARARDIRSFKENYEVLLKLLEPTPIPNFAIKKVLVPKLLVLAPERDFVDIYDPKDPPITLVLADHLVAEVTA